MNEAMNEVCIWCAAPLTDETRANLGPGYPGIRARFCRTCAAADAAEYAADAALHSAPSTARRPALWQELENAGVDEENLLPGVYRQRD